MAREYSCSSYLFLVIRTALSNLEENEYDSLCMAQKLALFDWLLSAFYETDLFISLMKQNGHRKLELLKEKIKVGTTSFSIMNNWISS
jgi:hypothetical protein